MAMADISTTSSPGASAGTVEELERLVAGLQQENERMYNSLREVEQRSRGTPVPPARDLNLSLQSSPTSGPASEASQRELDLQAEVQHLRAQTRSLQKQVDGAESSQVCSID